MNNGNLENSGPAPVSAPLRLLIVGQKRTGRSSVGNTLLGRDAFDTWGGANSAVAHGHAHGRLLTVVDTSGWGAQENLVPREEKQELLSALYLCEPGPHVLLLVVPILHFGRAERAALRKRMEVLTEGVWRHTMVVFTLGDHLHAGGIQDFIQTSGEDLQWLMEKCRYRHHVLNNKKVQDMEQVSGLLERAEDMLLENGGWHFSLHMYCRLEEEWSRREREMKEKILQRLDGGTHGSNPLVKLVYHG